MATNLALAPPGAEADPEGDRKPTDRDPREGQGGSRPKEPKQGLEDVGAGGLLMSEAEMLKSLKALGNYVILPMEERDQSPRRRGSGYSHRGHEQSPHRRVSHSSHISNYEDDSFRGRSSHNYNVPKLSPFSGDDPPIKGDISYAEWRFDVSCLDGDEEISPSLVVQAIRRSLRGTARKMLIPLGTNATIRDILSKLDALFGDISTHGMLMQEFFNSKQKQGESVTNFGCRLESLLQTAINNGSMNRASKNDLLRHKFWTSLHSDKLKSQTRHKYDSITSFNELLREIRTVEKELDISSETSNSSGQQGAQKKKGQSQAVSCEVEQQHATSITDLGKEVDQKLKALEDKLSSQIENKFDQILSKLGETKSQDQQRQGQRSGNRGYRGRGGYRGRKWNDGDKSNSKGDNPKE